MAGVEISTEREIVYPDPELVASMIGENNILLMVPGTDGVYASDKGFAFNTTTTGFSGDLHILTALDPDGAIIGSKIFDHTETENEYGNDGFDLVKKSFGEKLIGMTSADEFDAVAVSGATYTSDGYKAALETVFDSLKPAQKMYDQMTGAATGLAGVDISALEIENLKAVYSCNEGYLIDTMAPGYSGDVHILFGIDQNGAIFYSKIYHHTETENEYGNDGFDLVKKSYGEKLIGMTSADEYDSIAVSGATYTSTAYKDCVTAAFNAYSAVKGA